MDGTHVPCKAQRTLNCWATREAVSRTRPVAENRRRGGVGASSHAVQLQWRKQEAGWLEREVDALNVGRRFEQKCFLCFRKGSAGASLVAQR